MLLRRVEVSVLRHAISLRRHAISGLGLRIRSTVRYRRIHLGSNMVARSLMRMAVGDGRRISRSSSKTRRTSTPPRSISSAGPIVGCLVHANRPAVKFDIVHGSYCILGITLLGVTHKSETATTAGISILDHHRFLNGTKLLKLLAKGAFLSMPGQAAYEELRHGLVLLTRSRGVARGVCSVARGVSVVLFFSAAMTRARWLWWCLFQRGTEQGCMRRMGW